MMHTLQFDKLPGFLEHVTEPAQAFKKIWGYLPPADNGNVCCRIDCDGGLFLKGQTQPFSFSLRRLRRRWRIMRECRGLAWMRSAGIEVPDVLGWGAEYCWGLPVRSFILQRQVSDAVDLQRYLTINAQSRSGLEPVLRSVGTSIRGLHDAGIAHRDLFMRNILIEENSEDTRVVFIDCPRSERRGAGMRGNFLQRSDLYMFARDALCRGMNVRDVGVVLKAASESVSEPALQYALLAYKTGKARPLRCNFWLIFGV